MSTVFNRNKVDFTKETMFFGAEQNTQRYDVFKYPIFDKLAQQQLGYFWRLKRSACRRIAAITLSSETNRSSSSRPISNIRPCWIRCKVEAYSWPLVPIAACLSWKAA